MVSRRMIRRMMPPTQHQLRDKLLVILRKSLRVFFSLRAREDSRPDFRRAHSLETVNTMAGQQQQILDTIFNMKRKLLRKDDSDAEDSETPLSNKKQDLRRKVHYARASDPDFLTDAHPYKKRIEHAGYHRSILQRNPPRYDPDGDVVEVDDEYDEEDDVEPVEENPYGDIQLESMYPSEGRRRDTNLPYKIGLLAPLTSAADLPNHPALNVAYTSRHLTDLASEVGVLSRKEHVTIARAKNLIVKLQGDSTFAPAALAAMSNAPIREPWSRELNGRTEGDQQHGTDAEMQDSVESAHDVDMEDAGQPNGHVNGAHLVTNGTHGGHVDLPHENGDRAQSATEDVSDTASQQTHQMTTRTRARAHAASTPSPPQSPSSRVHPLFIHPTESLPDRDFGLPAQEAEDARMLLMAYIQKQEEVARITSDLYQGLLQADRMRQDVFKWSKAEAHVGEMSDGEDWYDNEEWGLDQDLAKGRDEEEDETAVAGKKSTRQRHDVVIAGLNPSEDYKTSVLSGLSPTIIMECASRGLAFQSYQTAQEIIYQEHLAKGLTEKYNTLSQQMDQLIHDANSQIKSLQDKMQAMQAEQESLQDKNHELAEAYKEKAKAQQQTLKLYQGLKAQVMASHVAHAAGDEAAYTLQTARRDRFIDRLPGTRTGSSNYNQMAMPQQPGSNRLHERDMSRSSGSSGRQRQGGGVQQAPPFHPHLQGRGLTSRVHTSRKFHIILSHFTFYKLSMLTPSQKNPLPSPPRPNPIKAASPSSVERVKTPISTLTRASPMMIRQPIASGGGGGGVAPRDMTNFSLAGKSSRRPPGAGNSGALGR
ncbi:RXT2 [Pyrenophora seminiperda CCB06]|uniref:RXT2 n=1 Tax=Pyrenophora seminiperda CCB06 TaxID=1302712 RepID=A0A3M7M3Y9_9PLEO|nr:RXT2 [Pyrenophora seminiperda CCB06]